MTDKYIRMTCACGKKLKAPASNAGGKGKCPNCGGEFIIPKTPRKTFLARHLYPLIAIAGFLVVGCVVLALIFLPQPKESNVSDVGLGNHIESNPETAEITWPQYEQEIALPPQISPETIQAIIADIRENEDEHKAMFILKKARQEIESLEWEIEFLERYISQGEKTAQEEIDLLEKNTAQTEACSEKIAQLDAEIKSNEASIKYEKDKYGVKVIADCEHNDKVLAENKSLRDKIMKAYNELFGLYREGSMIKRKHKKIALSGLQYTIKSMRDAMDKPHLLVAYVDLTDAEKLIYSRRWEDVTEEDIEPDIYAFLLGEEGFFVHIATTGPMNVYGTWRKAMAQIKYKWNADDDILVFVEMTQLSIEWCKE